ncbi:hypothetical protein BC829DRAFT_480874 [Chytridium lagenaria]|nr:hypothetical protein BC829DRAFT_480874 [Chytridium lagenaria]
MLSVKTLVALVASSILAAQSVTSQGLKCDKGVVPGKFCFSNCEGGGIYVAAPPLVTAIDLPNFQLDFDPKDPWTPKATATNVKATLSIPDSLKDLKLQFTNAGSNIDVSPVGQPIVANLKTADTAPASGDSTSQTLLLALEKLFKDVTNSNGKYPLTMSGYANTRTIASSASAMALVKRDNSEQSSFLNHALVRRQQNSNDTRWFLPWRLWRSLNTVIKGLPVVLGGSKEKGIQLSIPLEITSPSNVILNTNTDVLLDLLFNNIKVGTVILSQVAIVPGVNTLSASSYDAVESIYWGQDSGVVVANGKSSNMPSLDLAFASLRLTQNLPSSKPAVDQALQFRHPHQHLLFPLSTKANIIAINPFDSPVSIVYLRASLEYQNKVIGTIDQPVVGFNLASKGSATSPTFKLVLKINFEAIKAIFKAIGKGLKVVVKSELTVQFGGYDTTIDYIQEAVPANLLFKI